MPGITGHCYLKTLMKQESTKVLFLRETNNSILAVFTETPEANNMVACYSHVGQHSACTEEYYKALYRAFYRDYKPLFDELTNQGYQLHVLNPDRYEPIKTAFTSETTEGRTIIVYHDGGVKVFDQGPNWDSIATVTYYEPDEFQQLIANWSPGQIVANFDPEELQEIIDALKAP